MLYIFGSAYTIDFKQNLPKNIIDQVSKQTYFLFHDKADFAKTALIRGRAKKDAQLLSKILTEEGYFDNRVDVVISKEKRIIQFQLYLGDLYKVNEITSTVPEIDLYEILKIKKNDQARLQALKESQEVIAKVLKNLGYAFPKIEKPLINVDPENKVINVHYEIDKGYKKVFGEVVIKNNTNIKDKFILKKVAFKKGQVFSEELIEKTHKAINDSGLVSHIEVKPQNVNDKNVPVKIKFLESPPRTFGFDAIYSSNEGPGGKIFWEHRNLRGMGESLKTYMQYSKIKSVIGLSLARPYIFNTKYEGFADAEFMKEDIDAYYAKTYSTSFGFIRPMTNRTEYSFGVGFEKTIAEKPIFELKKEKDKLKVVEKDKKRFNIFLISLPITYKWDNTNNVFDPTKGNILTLRYTPYIDMKTHNFHAHVFEGSLAHIQKLSQKITLFSKVSTMHVFGKGLDDLVPTKRVYLGGNDTLKSYGYQKATALDLNDNPIGALSSVVVVNELRFKVKETWGFNVFQEDGRTFRKPFFKEGIKESKGYDWFHGTGISFTYFSKIAPIQVGIAVPWRRRVSEVTKRKIDSAFQIYAGIGFMR